MVEPEVHSLNADVACTDAPGETILQRIWQFQRLRRSGLRTLEGQRLVVLHPGFLNRGPGPDFQEALLQFGDEEPRTGDVEIDRQGTGWKQHHHQGNPAYQRVILHVLWNHRRPSPAPCPGLALEPHLDSPLVRLQRWARAEPGTLLPEDLMGHCAAPLQALSSGEQEALLRHIALGRFRRKGDTFLAWARESGWEHALWTGLMRCLGYRANAWPMQRLAELTPHFLEPGLSPDALLARLLGVGGLLPVELPAASPDGAPVLRRLWDHWWRVREDLRDIQLPPRIWRWQGTRPANHPTRRLVWAAHWLSRGDMAARLQAWLTSEAGGRNPSLALWRLLEAPPDPFWSWHASFHSKRLPRPHALLGRARLHDMAVNVILPWLWTRSTEGGSTALRRRIEACYRDWPAGQDNALLRRARERLLGTHRPPKGQGAACQQGLLEVLGAFCVKSDACCRGCGFPERLRNWGGTRGD